MVFSSYVFLFIFLPITLIGYFIVGKSYKNIWLLIASLVFYSWNSPRYTLILLLSILINWAGAYWMRRVKPKYKKFLLVITVGLNLCGLIYFKYANFIVENIESLARYEIDWVNITLPLGISFFTFQGMSYVIDIYRNDGEVLKNPLDVALYISLFPQLVAGPIVRFKSIVSEIYDRRSDADSITAGFQRFIYGLAKKIILADTFGMIADAVFAMSEQLVFEISWVGILAYTLQIYYDFSGYSDMAIGLGKILGFHFNENFNYPYMSQTITEFWQRWHISLSTWFRDYIYIPLGGNRVKKSRHIFNISLVWALTGIWHGANWTFLVWGAYYGILLIVEKYIIPEKFRKCIPTLVKWFFTFILVMVGWVIFRADNISVAKEYLSKMFSFKTSIVGTRMFMRYLINYRFFWVLGCFGVFPILKKLRQNIEIKCKKWVIMLVENVYVCMLMGLSILYLIAGSYNAFIYFQF